MRPATAPSSGRTSARSGAPVAESSVGTESPDLPRRRIRHQGSPPFLPPRLSVAGPQTGGSAEQMPFGASGFRPRVSSSPSLPLRCLPSLPPAPGELPPQYLEQLKQKQPCPPAHGSHSQAASRRIQLAAPNNRREDPAALSKGRKPRKPGDGKGSTPPGQGPSDPVATPLPARFSSPDFLPSSYVPSFPAALPTRPR